MSEREYQWTERGRESARANGVGLAEVIEALFSIRPLVNVIRGGLLAVCGQAANGRLVTVMCERLDPHLIVYRIVGARPATAWETHQWEERQ